MKIHATAIVSPSAELADDVEIQPFTIIGPHVKIGAGTVVGPHCVIDGATTIGKNNRIFSGAQLGVLSQDLKHKEGEWVGIVSRAGETTLRAKITERVQPGVVYTTFHHPESGANVITTDNSDWATNCPEYKVTAVQVQPVFGTSEWQNRSLRGVACSANWRVSRPSPRTPGSSFPSCCSW